MPELVCSLCGRTENVPKWHPESGAPVSGTARPRAGAKDRRPYICPACADRVRASALHQRDDDATP